MAASSLTELEKMQGIVVKEHFVIPGGTTRALVETKKNIDTFNLTLKNDSKTIELTLSLRKLDNGLYVSLPSFSKVEQDQESAALSH